MSFRKLSLNVVYKNILRRNVLSSVETISLGMGSKCDIVGVKNLLSRDESKALWIKINQTLQIIH